jgi:AraC-like DNA-binding protein
MGREILFETPTISVHRVDCPGGHLGWSAPEESGSHGLVLIRRGLFRRRANGIEIVADRTVCYFERPGEEQQIAHPTGADVCTWISFHPELWTSVMGDEAVSSAPVHLQARHHLWHLLLIGEGASTDRHLGEELVLRLLGDVRLPVARRRLGGGAATGAARKRLVDQAREALANDLDVSLVDLASMLAVSPHHLSRVFSAELGQTFSRYRLSLRVRWALDRLSDDEPVSQVAAETGFADHAHLTKAIKKELGETPSALRRLLHDAPGTAFLDASPGRASGGVSTLVTEATT